MTPRNELACFYDGPAPEDAEAALACGGFAMLARFRARQAGLHCDAAACAILSRRRRWRMRDHGQDSDRERALAAGLSRLRTVALTLRRVAIPETGDEN